MTNARTASLSALLGVFLACEDRPPPSVPSPEPPAGPPAAASPTIGPPAKREAATQDVPPGALDVPEGGCRAAEGDPDLACGAARALPVTLTWIPTKLGGILPIPGGEVHNHSTRDIYAVGSVPGAPGAGSWEMARVPAGASLGGDLRGGSPQTTTDVDWVSATPPTPDGRGGFTYGPMATGVKVFDGGELTVVDRPGGGVRLLLTAAGSLPSKITTAGQMNGDAAIVYVRPR